MPNQPKQKIYLTEEYPCPCHGNGKLQQLVLTEAFGCDRCRRIFVLQDDGLAIEELATTYPYKRRYAWHGKRWRVCRSFPRGNLSANSLQWDNLALWLQGLGALVLSLGLFRWHYGLTAASPLLNLVSSMAIAMFIFIVITLWLFSQG